jgi:murein DD-endopeptidase MepM/ murein hydrolase activator NlpD
MSRLRALAGALGLALALAACASSPPSGPVHVLKPGETVYRLSRYYGVSVDAIVRANRIHDVSAVPVGARLVVPGATRTPPRQSIALASFSPSSPNALPLPRPDPDRLFAWPVQGKLNSRFGWRRGRRHQGIDIGSRPGTPIRAAAAGRVVHSGWLGDYGRVVIVKHTGDYSTVYAHNRRNRVSKGAFVERGEVLAEVGSSGNASGPHLHFEIREGQRARDPLRYLP